MYEVLCSPSLIINFIFTWKNSDKSKSFNKQIRVKVMIKLALKKMVASNFDEKRKLSSFARFWYFLCSCCCCFCFFTEKKTDSHICVHLANLWPIDFYCSSFKYWVCWFNRIMTGVVSQENNNLPNKWHLQLQNSSPMMNEK